MIKEFCCLIFVICIPFTITAAYAKADNVSLLIIQPKGCVTCDTETAVKFLKRELPGLSISYLYYPDKKADSLVRNLGILGLPAYLLGKEVEKAKNFAALKRNLQLKGDFYILRPQFSGFSYFVGRQKLKGKLDLFISLYDKESPKLLEAVKEFNPSIHFLAVEQAGRFDAAKGELEVEDYLRAVCIQKYYPQDFWNYISCRAKNIGTSWWESCLPKIDMDKLRSCALGQEGRILLKQNTSLNKELQIMFGPTYLLDNQEIFASNGAPTKEELRKIIKR